MSGSIKGRGDLGKLGERVAVQVLERAGLRILERNWRCREGEIDVVACDGQCLVIVEVKTRTSTRFGTPAEAVAGRKLGRLRRLAGLYAASQSVRYDAVRIDVVAILRRAGRTFVQHLKGVS